MIKTIIFDLGGVILTLDQQQAASRFQAMGLQNVAQMLDPYTQQGIFGDVEAGRISAQEFMASLGRLVGREVTFDECCHAWQGYALELPQRNLDALQRLRHEGYRLILLSNTNPFMMQWVDSPRFDGRGHSIRHYMDACYLSFEQKVMKPDEAFFLRVLEAEQLVPSECLFVDDGPRNVAAASKLGINTFCPRNGDDWTSEIYNYLPQIEPTIADPS